MTLKKVYVIASRQIVQLDLSVDLFETIKASRALVGDYSSNSLGSAQLGMDGKNLYWQ